MNTQMPITDEMIRAAITRRVSGAGEGDLRDRVLSAAAAVSQRQGWWISAEQLLVLPQRRTTLPRPIFESHSRAALVGLVALLVLGLLGAVIAAGMLPSTNPLTRELPSIVVQQSNHLRDPDFRVTQTRFSPGATVGTMLPGLPQNAVGLRWSPDGARLAYFEQSAPAGRMSLSLTSLVLANRDGSNPVRVTAPRPLEQYVVSNAFVGVQWAPAGRRFLLAWTTGTCPGVSANCVPAGGIDVFDAAGNLISTIDTPDNIGNQALWSADGLGVAWTSGVCDWANNVCTTSAYHWRRFGGDAAVTTIPVGGQVVWGQDGLLHVVKIDDAGGFTGVVTMAPDGSDVRDVPWVIRPTETGPVWSPDGRLLAAVDPTVGAIRVRDFQAGTEIVVPYAAGFAVPMWAPDSSRLALVGEASSPESRGYGFWVINTDGTGLVSLGDGEDFGWLPTLADGRG